ncbi:hypothetical protein PQX77_019481 [Marasmius sp. AFHP31]|nr:hypothetical protein PQX77_019481 [Marasmius sp. AFHP31]
MVGVGVAMAQESLVVGEGKSLKIGNEHPLIHYHGRWDASPGTWWAGSGFTLNIANLKSLQLELGPNTTQPFAPVSVIIDGGPITTVNASQGLNDIPIPSPAQQKSGTSTIVKFNVQGWQNNRINLKNVIVNLVNAHVMADAKLQPYKPSKLTFQFIGDSLVSGQFLPLGINQAWPYLAAERYGAEYRINSQPGATLVDMVSYGNQHGVSFMFFRGFSLTGEGKGTRAVVVVHSCTRYGFARSVYIILYNTAYLVYTLNSIHHNQASKRGIKAASAMIPDSSYQHALTIAVERKSAENKRKNYRRCERTNDLNTRLIPEQLRWERIVYFVRRASQLGQPRKGDIYEWMYWTTEDILLDVCEEKLRDERRVKCVLEEIPIDMMMEASDMSMY